MLLDHKPRGDFIMRLKLDLYALLMMSHLLTAGMGQ
jgi:hypothetical protein